MRSTTDSGRLVMQTADTMRQALAAARTHTTRPQRDERARDLIKGVEHGRFKGLEHLLFIGFNLLDRGCPLEYVEEIGHVYNGTMRAYSEAVRDDTPRSIEELHLAEQAAQGRRELAEAAMTHDMSPRNVAEFLVAAGAYEVANDRYVAAIRQATLQPSAPRPVLRAVR